MHFIHVQVNFHSLYVFFGELGSESHHVGFYRYFNDISVEKLRYSQIIKKKHLNSL